MLAVIGTIALTGTACTNTLSNSPIINQTIVNSEPDKTIPPPVEDTTKLAPLHSGIQGTVYLSPVCPVQTTPPEPGCEPRPTSLTVYIEPIAPAGKWFSIQSGKDGKYSVAAAPGEYSLSSTPPGYLGGPMLRYPNFGPIKVLVRASTFTEQDIQVDTGIR